MHTENGLLPACDRRARGAAIDAVVDVDALYEGPEEVDEVCERMIELEFIEEGIPTFASARAAISLPIRIRSRSSASSYFRHSPAAMSSCIPGSVGG